ncbi:MAG: hypothetical protein FWF86_00300 [Clostridia bacterium]|nr:hypothetical protein [Clostridia bacterium]
MKRFHLLFLCVCLLLPVCAQGERLALTVNEYFRCDAELPAGIPKSLPVHRGEFIIINPEKAIAMLMPGKGPREDLANGDVTVGIGDGEHDYMLIQKDSGRICFDSEYVSRYLLELIPGGGYGDGCDVAKKYLPTDAVLDFMTPEEAVRQAADLMQALGIEVATEGAAVYTLECASYAAMQETMRDSEWLARTTRKRALRYLEPLSSEHEGYYVNLTPTFSGRPYTVYDSRKPACVLITRQGVEFVETGFNLRVTGAGDEKPLVPVEEALKIAATGSINMEDRALCTIEEITLLYRFNWEKQTMTPYWIFDYCSDGAGGMKGLTFDHWTKMYGIGVDAHNGKVIDQTIF